MGSIIPSHPLGVNSCRQLLYCMSSSGVQVSVEQYPIQTSLTGAIGVDPITIFNSG